VRVDSEVTIAAPADRVFAVIVDVEQYPEWNSFTPRMTLRNDAVVAGTEFDLDCQMIERQLLRGEREVVLAVDRERHVLCNGTSRTRGRWGIQSERWQRCHPLPDGRTRVENYEIFRGPLTLLLWLLYRGRLRRAFARYCADLKRRAEALATEAGPGKNLQTSQGV
jgi:hypothetical protein